jgi:hypothetical protein
MATIVPARALRPGDVCVNTNEYVAHTFTDGLYWHHADGSFIEPRARFDRAKVEVFTRPADRPDAPLTRRVWGARTGIKIIPAT